MTQPCRSHAEAEAIAACESCRAPLCAGCAHRALSRTFCATCLALRLGEEPGEPRRIKRPWLAVVLTLLPGLGQVYLGFVARGIAQFAILWLVMLVAQRPLPGALLDLAAAVAVVLAWSWCARDALRTAREVNARGYPTTAQEARSITRGPVRDADVRLAGIGLVVLGALLLAQELGGLALELLRFTLPFALIGAGWWILRRARAAQARTGSAAEGSAGA